MVELPDMPHINLLIDKLWKGREYGQAAIMVGAGFSRNAESINPSAKQFPSWSDLGKAMYRRLNPADIPFDGHYIENEISAISGDGVLKLAFEYEKSFGRTGLDSLLRNTIPDSQYRPGRLHKLLLNLPWSDVFTTNYDTLLERTGVVDKNYCLVTTHEDIPGSTKPRIVKLHGSFPSNRPFIFTEEDYRTYPAIHAPFVNMVQQSLMENTFCLIGFSSTDPNFLQWIGWVRDHLRTASLKIYLCGLFDMSIAKRRVLECKNIIPINLSHLPLKDVPEEARHAAALDWFLQTLKCGKPPNKYTWPNIRVDFDEELLDSSDYELPEIPTKRTFALSHTPSPPQFREILSNDLAEKLVDHWRSIRILYPGWVVCPKENRDIIWMETERWLHDLPEGLLNLNPPMDILLAYELNWRLELTMTPLADPWAEVFSKVIERYSPFDDDDFIDTSKVKSTSEEYQNLDWSRISKCWIEVLFALLKKYRETQNAVLFDSTYSRFKNLCIQNNDLLMRMNYEKCLFHLSRFEINELEESLKTWKINDNTPFWMIRKAALLIEYGDRNEAKVLTEAALKAIRASANTGEEDFALTSQEGWAMILSEMAKHEFGLFSFSGYHSRWEKLRIIKIDPLNEFETVKRALLAEPPKFKPEKKEEIGFFPNTRRVSYQYSGRSLYYDLKPAYTLIRLFEEGGVQFGTFVKVDRAAIWIKDIDFAWAIGLLIRSSSKKMIKQWFDRVTVAVLPSEEVDYLTEWLLKVLENLIARYKNHPEDLEFKKGSLARNIIEPVLTVLSRLAFRLNNEKLLTLFDICESLSKSPAYRSNLRLDPVGNLLKSIIHSFSPRERLALLERFLRLPVPGWSNFDLQIAEDWREPFSYKEMWEIEDFDHDYTSDNMQGIINDLIEMAGSKNKQTRNRAVLRMMSLHRLGILSSTQKKAFENQLWADTEKDTCLPANTNLLFFNFLPFSETLSFSAKNLLKAYILNFQPEKSPEGPDTEQTDIRKTSGPSIFGNYLIELKGSNTFLSPIDSEKIDWTVQESEKLLEITSIYWDTYKNHIKSVRDIFEFANDWRNAFYKYLEVLSIVILPRLTKAKDEAKSLALRIIDEMQDTGLAIQIAAPSLLFIKGMNKADVSALISAGFSSLNEKTKVNTIFGLFYWMGFAQEKKLPPPPKYLIEELINMIIARREPGLGTAIAQMSIIVEKLGSFLTDKNIKALCFALDILRNDTALPTHDELYNKDVNLYLKRPDYRSWSALLAFRIHQYLSKNGKEIPEVIDEWKKICETDTLPEVRHAWKTNY